MRRLVLFVEGEGESDALPVLVRRLLTEKGLWSPSIFVVDQNPFRVGHVNGLLKNQCSEWKRLLRAATKRHSLGGVLLIVDGDVKKIGANNFCAANVARLLADTAKAAGGGVSFSVAVVLARQEFESWLIAGIESLAGKRLNDGRVIAADAKTPVGNLEESPRDAKGWLRRIVEGGYKPTRDQAAISELVSLQQIRDRKLRSFQRFESAVSQLVTAIRSNEHLVSPQ